MITYVFVIYIIYSLHFTIVPIFFFVHFLLCFALPCFSSAAQIFSEHCWRTTNTSVSKAVFNFFFVLTSFFFTEWLLQMASWVFLYRLCMYVYIKWAWLHKKAIHNIERLMWYFRSCTNTFEHDDYRRGKKDGTRRVPCMCVE